MDQCNLSNTDLQDFGYFLNSSWEDLMPSREKEYPHTQSTYEEVADPEDNADSRKYKVDVMLFPVPNEQSASEINAQFILNSQLIASEDHLRRPQPPNPKPPFPSRYSSSEEQGPAKRSDTNLVKILFNKFKQCLSKSHGCPVDMDLYIKACGFGGKKSANLHHFEAAIWYVEQLDKKRSGLLNQFREYLRLKVFECIVEHGRHYYEGKQQLSQYQAYTRKIFEAMLEYDSTNERLQVMYFPRPCQNRSKLNELLSALNLVLLDHPVSLPANDVI